MGNKFRIPGPNNILYEGECNKDGKPHGNGEMRYADGSTFTGVFEDGFPSQGVFLYSKTVKYTGKIKDLQPSGRGILQNPDGKFQGEFANGEFVNGIISYSNGNRYQGHILNSRKHGDNTKFQFSNGDTFVGTFKEDMFERGTYCCKKQKSKYSGTFKNQLMHGQDGVLEIEKKLWYKGGFEEGKFHGEGVLKNYQQNYEYDGKFIKGKKSLRGKLITYDNFTNKKILSQYQGEFVENEKHGSGVYTFGNRKYEGTFEGNKFNGQGKLFHSNGDVYTGNFLNNHKSGRGEYIFNSSQQYQKYSGQFLNNLFDGTGILLYKNGDKYDGEFQKNKKHGIGKYYRGNGDVLEGVWKQDKKQGDFTIYYDQYPAENNYQMGNSRIAADLKQQSGTFVGDERDGEFRVKYNSGEREIMRWKNGKRLFDN